LKEKENTDPGKSKTGHSHAKNDPAVVGNKGFSLTELIDIGQMEPVLADFCNAMGIASAIVDLEGNVLTSARWQRICTDFHRTDARARARCVESDTELAANLEEGRSFSIYHCKNGLTDAASPIIIEGRHVANFFVGQFLTQAPNRDYFKHQARKFGFDVADYLDALDMVPIISPEKLPAILGFLTGFTNIVASLGVERIRAKKAEQTARVRAEDAEEAKKELTRYKAHLEGLVEDRTERLRDSE
jgi:ligand-binding sensor protein